MKTICYLNERRMMRKADVSGIFRPFCLWMIGSLFLMAWGLSGAAQILVTVDGQQTLVETSSVAVGISPDGTAVFGVDDTQVQMVSESGQPAIPWQVVQLLLPANATLETVGTRLQASYVPVLGSWYVAPAPPMGTRDPFDQEIVVWPSGRTIVDGHDAVLYGTNSFWPQDEARLMSTGRLSHWQLAEVAVPLFRYNPVTGALLELSAATLNVTSEKRGLERARAASQIARSHNRERARQLAVNFEQAAATYTSGATGSYEIQTQGEMTELGDPIVTAPNLSAAGYVIITTNAIRNSSVRLAEFVAHKQSTYTVNIITETQYGSGTGDTAANNIRAWLQANYTNNAYGNGGILYVLLIGDPRTNSGSVPMKMCIGDHPTDYFYAELTSNWDANGNGIFGEDGEWDKYFEVYVGRIPYYGNISDMDRILQKTIAYEAATDTAWRRTMLLPMVPLDSSTPAYQMGEQIKYNLLEPCGISSCRIYEENYGLMPPPEYLLSSQYPATEWSQGAYGAVIWQTHGWDQGAAGIITTGDTSSLNNAYPSAVWQGSFAMGQQYTKTNLGFSILKNGGIGTFAASRNGWYWVGQTNFTNTNSVGGLGYQYARRIAERKTLGQALWDTKEAMGFWDKNYYVYNLYGDPSIRVMPPEPAFMVTPTHGLQFNVAYGGSTTGTSVYSLKNNSTSPVSWTVTGGNAAWYELSAYSGTVGSQGSVNVTIALTAETKHLPVGAFTDTLLFRDAANTLIEERTVTLYVYPKRKIAHWPLNETAGTTAADASGNSLDGTVVNTRFDDASTAGMYGRALQFDGSDDHIAVPGFTGNFSELTLSVWIKATDWNGNRRVLQKGDDSSEYRLLSENGRFVFEVGSTRLQLNTLPATGSWVHVAAVYDGSAMRVYYDKILQGTIARTGMAPSSSKQLFIGSKNAGAPSGDRFRGVMDDVRIYNHAKNAAGIEALYEGEDPAEAINPYDGAAGTLLVTDLQWSMGLGAVQNDIYFGTDYDTILNATVESICYKGRQTANRFSLSTLKRYTEYFWRIDQVDVAGAVSRGSVWRFTTGNGRGGISRQAWFNISGNAVTNLTGNARYPASPDFSDVLNAFEAPRDWADNYGTRVRGFLVPPATGSYNFWIASDDYSELWLSSDENPSNMARIAYVSGYTGYREWLKYPATQPSGAIILTAGKPYYIMALHKEGGGGDHLSVAWRGPGFGQQIITGDYLMPYASDYDWNPSFSVAVLDGDDAVEGYVYSGSIAGTAAAFDGSGVFYSRTAGPLWLNVAQDGTLSGVPGDGDVGENVFGIRATDARGALGDGLVRIKVRNTFTGERGLSDLSALAAQWLRSDCADFPLCGGADLTGDGNVDNADLIALSEMWLVENAYGGLVAHWSFDVDASDAVSGNDGTLMNGAAVIQDDAVYPLGKGALSLDGIDDYVDILGFKGISGGASRTCSAWVKTTTVSSDILSWGEDYSGGRWSIQIGDGGELRIAVLGGNIVGTTKINDGAWHHIAVVLEDDGNSQISNAILYVDGRREPHTTSVNHAVNTGSFYNVRIGSLYGGHRFYNGLIDEVRIYDRALSLPEIEALAILNLQLHLSFDNVDGNVANDLSVHNRVGQLINGPLWQSEGVSGGALYFDGIDDYVDIPGFKGISGGSSRTCSAWVKTITASSDILSWGEDYSGGRWSIQIGDGGELRIAVLGGNIVGTTKINDGAWHHIAVVLEDDGNSQISNAILYVDGKREPYTTSVSHAVNTGSFYDVRIGSLYSGHRYYNGLIDEVRIYSRAMNDREIEQLVR